MRMQINDDNLNNLLSTMFAMGIAKMLSIHNILVKNKNLV